MKTISISLYKRQDYTKILFDLLAGCCDIDDYAIICCEALTNKIIDLAKQPPLFYYESHLKIYNIDTIVIGDYSKNRKVYNSI